MQTKKLYDFKEQEVRTVELPAGTLPGVLVWGDRYFTLETVRIKSTEQETRYVETHFISIS